MQACYGCCVDQCCLSCNIFHTLTGNHLLHINIGGKNTIHIHSFLLFSFFLISVTVISGLISYQSYLDSSLFPSLLSYLLHHRSVVCIVYHLFSLTRLPSTIPSPMSLYERAPCLVTGFVLVFYGPVLYSHHCWQSLKEPCNEKEEQTVGRMR